MPTGNYYIQGDTEYQVLIYSSGSWIEFSNYHMLTPLIVGQWNDYIHVNWDGASNEDRLVGKNSVNNKYISDTQVQIGETIKNISSALDSDCTFRINITNAPAITIINGEFWDYATGETITIKVALPGDSTWTTLGDGQGNGMDLPGSASSTSHDYYMLMTVSPTNSGELSALFYTTIYYY